MIETHRCPILRDLFMNRAVLVYPFPFRKYQSKKGDGYPANADALLLRGSKRVPDCAWHACVIWCSRCQTSRALKIKPWNTRFSSSVPPLPSSPPKLDREISLLIYEYALINDRPNNYIIEIDTLSRDHEDDRAGSAVSHLDIRFSSRSVSQFPFAKPKLSRTESSTVVPVTFVLRLESVRRLSDSRRFLSSHPARSLQF